MKLSDEESSSTDEEEGVQPSESEAEEEEMDLEDIVKARDYFKNTMVFIYVCIC